MFITQQLDFDVPWLLNKFFDKNIWGTKRGHRFALRLIEQPGQVFGLHDDSHATAATAVCRFEDDRVACGFGQLLSVGNIGDRFGASPKDGNTCRAGNFASSDLISERLENFDRRPDEQDSSVIACGSQGGIFREKSISRMDGVDISLLCDADDCRDIEIGSNRFSC